MLANTDITVVQGFTFSTSLIKCTFVQGTNTIMDIMMKVTILMYHLIVQYINLLHTVLSRTWFLSELCFIRSLIPSLISKGNLDGYPEFL